MAQYRTVEQILLYKLVMNPVVERAESAKLVAWSDEKEKLIRFYENEKVDTWVDNEQIERVFHKNFRRYSPLEWYNPISSFFGLNIYGCGIQEEWVDVDVLTKITKGFKV